MYNKKNCLIAGSGFTSTGTIEVSMNGAAFTSATLSGNTITWTVPGTAAGTYPLVVKVSGQSCRQIHRLIMGLYFYYRPAT